MSMLPREEIGQTVGSHCSWCCRCLEVLDFPLSACIGLTTPLNTSALFTLLTVLLDEEEFDLDFF